ncbi:alpha/beta fold hydrolase [Capillimicrobium parvum]|uniref:alpha/beta fold hydrolase n=1 Tax=Capillimicrobium parvum TaxID=2884022 RepID=UPI00216AF32E|nr:alpha/beta fold hydrolase [Capillimicrobium parvum]
MEVDGLHTAYRRSGSGEPVLYLHGAAPYLTRGWLPFHEHLSESVDLVVPEHPGFGDTPLPPTLTGFADVVLHYDAFLRALDVDRPHVVGHALGGWIAMELAITYPERFSSLTLVAPAGLRLPGVPQPDLFRLTAREQLDVLLNGRADRYEHLLVLDGEPDDTLRAYAESVTHARLAWNPRYDVKLDERLGRVRIPTLVVRPDEDRAIPVEAAQRAVELIPNARLETVSGPPDAPTGHLLLLQEPRALAEHIAGHVAAHPRNEVIA